MTTQRPDPDLPPPDVMEWLHETYTPEGVERWLAVWREQPERRGRMERIARTPSGGT